ncbi:hypothetical protein B0H14DRAFT_1389124 [Mycena olivaceomarginata]|nr:hypothetical protein B0H14DRAFT_1389124 [Mycena olivaceomarginata]
MESTPASTGASCLLTLCLVSPWSPPAISSPRRKEGRKDVLLRRSQLGTSRYCTNIQRVLIVCYSRQRPTRCENQSTSQTRQ